MRPPSSSSTISDSPQLVAMSTVLQTTSSSVHGARSLVHTSCLCSPPGTRTIWLVTKCRSGRIFAAGISMREMDPSTSFGAFSPAASSPERTRKSGGAMAAIMGQFNRTRGLMPGQFATPTRHEAVGYVLLRPGKGTCQIAGRSLAIPHSEPSHVRLPGWCRPQALSQHRR